MLKAHSEIPLVYLIRNATVEDVPEMMRLERASATAAHWPEQQYQGLFARVPELPERMVLIAVEKENPAIIGCLIARHVSREWELENIVVNSEFRGKGIGTSLLTDLLSRIRPSQGETIFLEVRDSNTAARRLYEKAGFAETGRRKGYYSSPSEDAVLYSKTLESDSLSH